MTNTFILILLFGVTLSSYYSYDLAFPIVSVFSSVIYIILNLFSTRNLSISKSFAPLLWFLTIAYAYSFLSALFVEDINFRQLLLFPLFVLIIFSISQGTVNLPVKRLLSFIIILHLFFFYIQFLSFLFFDVKFDFLEFFNGEEQRIYGGSFVVPFLNKFIRPSGLFNEPGTYAVNITPLICAYAMTIDRNKFLSPIFILSLFSLVFSLSVQGIISFFVIALFSLFQIPSKRLISFLPFILLLLISVFFFSFTYLDYRFGLSSGVGNDTGIAFRVDTFAYYLKSLEAQYSLWPYLGPGILATTGIPNDLSMLVHTVFVFGILPSIIFTLFTINGFSNLGSGSSAYRNYIFPINKYWLFISFLLILLTKFSLFSPSGVLTLSLLISSASQPSEQVNA